MGVEGTKERHRRAGKACLFCSERKIRCSGVSPCSACAIRSLQCEFSTTSQKRGPKAGAKWQKREQHTSGPSSAIVGNLVDVYRAFVHPHWPMIDFGTSTSVRQLASLQPLLFKVMLTIAAATQVSTEQQKDELRSVLGDTEAVQRQADALTASLTSVQTLLLLSLIELGKGAHAESYRRCGQACVTALQLDLHRTERGTENEGLLVTFWAVYSLDKLLAVMLDKPMLLRRKDITTPLESVKERRISALGFSFLRQARLMTLLEQIIDETYTALSKRQRAASEDGLGSTYMESVRRISHQLEEWQESMPSSMMPFFYSSRHDQRSVSPQVITMTAWFHACNLLLHKPAFRLAQERTASSTVQQSYRKVYDNAAAISHCLDRYVQSYTARRIPTSWIFLTFLSAVIHASCIGHAQNQIDSLESERVYQRCLHHLREIAKTWRHAGQQVNTLQAVLQVFTSTNDEQSFGLGASQPTCVASSSSYRSDSNVDLAHANEMDISSLWNHIIASFDSPN